MLAGLINAFTVAVTGKPGSAAKEALGGNWRLV